MPKLLAVNTFAMDKNLQHQDIYLRALEPEDLALLYQIENDEDIWQHGANKAPISHFALKQYLENSLSQSLFESGELRLVIVRRSDNLAIGFIDLFDIDTYHARAGVGIVILPKLQGQGYGRQALHAIKNYARQFLHLHQLSAQIAASNLACRQIFIKEDFEECGCLKDWIRRPDGAYEEVICYQSIFPE